VRTCPICERRYDERAYQVVVSGLGSFDSVACVEAALRRRARTRRRELVFDLEGGILAVREQTADRAEPIPTDRENQPER
jgi:hypothetical protein